MPVNGNVSRTTIEKGIVLERYQKNAFESFMKDGKEVPGQPERYYVVVGSSADAISPIEGIVRGKYLDYQVTAEQFKKLFYQTPVEVEYEQQKGFCKPISLRLLDPKK